MFKINLLCGLTLCYAIVATQCDSTADTSSAVRGGFAFEIIMTKLQQLEDRINENIVNRYTSCKESSFSGIYTIQPEELFKEPMRVLCDQEYGSGGWIVIQHRFDGSTNFFRNWNEYKNGFGNLNGEFWLGLDRIYQLTVSRPYELVFVLNDFKGNKKFAKYDQFEIGNEKEKYYVKKLGAYSGTAGDSFSGTKGMKFSTFDADNDFNEKRKCAIEFAGAWWYKNCHGSNLNGKYLRGETKEYGTGMVWYAFQGNYYSLKNSKIMIRPKNV